MPGCLAGGQTLVFSLRQGLDVVELVADELVEALVLAFVAICIVGEEAPPSAFPLDESAQDELDVLVAVPSVDGLELLGEDQLVEGDVDESLVILLEGHVMPFKWLWSRECRRLYHVR